MLFKITEREKTYFYSTNEWCIYYDEDYHNYYLEFSRLMHKEHRPSFFILTKIMYDDLVNNIVKDTTVIDINLDELTVCTE